MKIRTQDTKIWGTHCTIKAMMIWTFIAFNTYIKSKLKNKQTSNYLSFQIKKEQYKSNVSKRKKMINCLRVVEVGNIINPKRETVQEKAGRASKPQFCADICERRGRRKEDWTDRVSG